jgi:hypothetical protein
MGATQLRERALIGLIKHGARVIDGPGRRFVSLDMRGLLNAARRRTALDDFGGDAFHEPLRRLIDSIENDARLSFVGRLVAREDLIRLLINRLKLQRDRTRHPEIGSEQIRRPIFIMGLPRTGSTLLHGLLAQDSANRVPLNWETMHPSPPPQRATYEANPQADLAERQIKWFHRLAPDFRKIHPVGARLPEECVIILSHSLLSFEFSTSFYVPAFQNWLDAQDLTPAYRFHYGFLQQLQWHCPAERWVLKAPSHLPGLAALGAVYPDACVVMTHRDPLAVVPSVASLHVVLRQTFSDAVNPLSVGPEVSAMLAGDIERGLQARDGGRLPANQFVDVWYADILRDPIATVRKIYAAFDLPPLKATAERRMRHYLAENPQDKHGTHTYSLATFGLDEGTERQRYRDYCARFEL